MLYGRRMNDADRGRYLIDSICVSRVSRHLELDVYSSHLLRTTPFSKLSDLDYVVDSALTAGTANDGLFVRSRERKVQREREHSDFNSRGTRSVEHCSMLLWNFREGTLQELSLPGTFIPVELSILENEYSKNFCPKRPQKRSKSVTINLTT